MLDIWVPRNLVVNVHYTQQVTLALQICSLYWLLNTRTQSITVGLGCETHLVCQVLDTNA